MEYIDLLTIIMDTDTKTTKEFVSLFNDVNSKYFIDADLLSDTPITKNVGEGRFMSIFKDLGIVYIDYLIDGKKSIKSCKKLIKLQFSTSVDNELQLLDESTLTSPTDDLYQYVWCANATIYNLVRDRIDFNHITEKEKYKVSYMLRKNKQNHFFLESKIHFANPQKTKNGYIINQTSLFNDIKPLLQGLIKGRENMTEEEKLAELDEIKEFFDEDFDDIDSDYEDIENSYEDGFNSYQ